MLEDLSLEGNRSTPKVVFYPENTTLLIEGESYPENAAAFYEPIISWAQQYIEESGRGINLHIRLLHINTSSSKALLVLFDILEEAHQNGKSSHVLWLFDEENEVAGEIGEDLSDGLELPFVIEKCS